MIPPIVLLLALYERMGHPGHLCRYGAVGHSFQVSIGRSLCYIALIYLAKGIFTLANGHHCRQSVGIAQPGIGSFAHLAEPFELPALDDAQKNPQKDKYCLWWENLRGSPLLAKMIRPMTGPTPGIVLRL